MRHDLRAVSVRSVALLALLLSSLGATAAVAAAGDVPTRSALAGSRFHVDPASPAWRQADALRRTRPADAALLERIASTPQAFWFGSHTRDVRAEVGRVVGDAARAGAVPVLVAYNIPGRDCGSHSAGGAGGAAAYRRWIRAFADGVGGRRAVVIVEPDALAQMDCVAPARRAERAALVGEAVRVLKARGATVYVDAGHARWVAPEEMADRLRRAGIAGADGFSLNVSNHQGNAPSIAYGERLSRLTGGKRFVIDTGRNGRGSTRGGEWCNARDQALGAAPTTRTGHPLVDAFLWIKRPGESDGACNGGPRAGAWWTESALGLARQATGRLAAR